MKIELREWTLENIDELIYVCNHADREFLSTRMPYPYSKDDALWYVNYINNKGNDGLFGAIVVDGEYCGSVSVERMEDVCEIDSEIGYHLLKEYQNRGIMSVVVKEVCQLAFEKMSIERITGMVYEPNIGSRRVLEKNGFELEGIKRKAVFKDGQYFNLCIYGKCKS